MAFGIEDEDSIQDPEVLMLEKEILKLEAKNKELEKLIEFMRKNG